MSLVDKSMVPFQNAYAMIICAYTRQGLRRMLNHNAALIVLILAGNTAFVSVHEHYAVHVANSRLAAYTVSV